MGSSSVVWEWEAHWEGMGGSFYYSVSPLGHSVARVYFLRGAWTSSWLIADLFLSRASSWYDLWGEEQEHRTEAEAKARIEQEWESYRKAQWILMQ